VEQDHSGEQAHFRARMPPEVRHECEPFVQEEKPVEVQSFPAAA